MKNKTNRVLFYLFAGLLAFAGLGSSITQVSASGLYAPLPSESVLVAKPHQAPEESLLTEIARFPGNLIGGLIHVIGDTIIIFLRIIGMPFKGIIYIVKELALPLVKTTLYILLPTGIVLFIFKGRLQGDEQQQVDELWRWSCNRATSTYEKGCETVKYYFNSAREYIKYLWNGSKDDKEGHDEEEAALEAALPEQEEMLLSSGVSQG